MRLKERMPLTLGTGFGRTENRAHNIGAIMLLGNRPTHDFEIDVIRLSKQIMMLLQPLSRFLEDAVEYGDGPAPSDDDQFRSIHGIVALAANLSIKVRVSPIIFYFYSERPGNLFDPDEQTDMDYSAYVASKSAVTEDHDERHSETKRRRALVRFALWPSIKRYSAGIPGNHEHETNGFRVYNISNSRVVYYWGLEGDRHRVSMDLQTFIEQRKRECRSTVVNICMISYICKIWS